MGGFVEGLDDVVLPEILLEKEGFVWFERKGVEGADNNVSVAVEVVVVEAEGG